LGDQLPPAAGIAGQQSWPAHRGRAQLVRSRTRHRVVGAATKDAPQRNLMNSPWWTDGDRLVVEISKTPVPLERVDFFYWGWTDQEEQIKRLRHEAR
jgi:hypothetical protein